MIDPIDSIITCDLSYTFTERKCDFNIMSGEISNIRNYERSFPYENHDIVEYRLKDLSRNI